MSAEPEIKDSPQPKKPRIIYPAFFAIFPVLSIYSANLSLVPYQMMIRPIGVTVVAALALWGLFAVILRDSGRGAVASSALIAMGFAFSRIETGFRNLYIPPEWDNWAWALLTVIVVAILAWKWRWHRILNILSLALVAAAVVQITVGIAQSSALMSASKKGRDSTASATKDLPDIIYIILDGYGRSDALKRALNYSNDSFIEGLEKRGFYVAKDAHANYCQTELSLASSLNMDFIPIILPKMAPQEVDRRPLTQIVDNNAVADYLRKKGYIFAAITSQFPPIQFDSADVNMRTRSGMTLIETALVQMTPLGNDKMAVNSMFSMRRSVMENAFDSLVSLSEKSARPRFVVAHILAPHPPFVFGADGQPVQQGMYGYWDGSDYMEHVSTPRDYREGYVGQAEYVGKRILKVLDVLLAGNGPKPVILVQGDHGSKLRLDQGTLDRTDVNECFPNLSAYYVPEPVRKNLYPGITPVNSFRVVFDGLFGDTMKLRPDRSWYSSYPMPFDFTDVTGRIADHTKMASIPVPNFGPKPSASSN